MILCVSKSSSRNLLTYAEIWRYALQIQLCQFVGQVSKVCAYIGTRNIEVAVFYKMDTGGKFLNLFAT